MVTVIIKSKEQATMEMQITKLKLEKEEQEKEIQIQQSFEKKIKKVCDYFSNLIEKAISNGDNDAWSTIMTNTQIYDNINPYVFAEVKEIFKKAGYNLYIYYYSDSWCRRSGKYATVHISWDIE